jgi:YgiT-type zinc finger domain-containing protein
MQISRCPSCESDRIKKVSGSVSREFEGETYTVSGVTYWACPACGERVYDQEAVRRIQAASPAFQGELTTR